MLASTMALMGRYPSIKAIFRPQWGAFPKCPYGQFYLAVANPLENSPSSLKRGIKRFLARAKRTHISINLPPGTKPIHAGKILGSARIQETIFEEFFFQMRCQVHIGANTCRACVTKLLANYSCIGCVPGASGPLNRLNARLSLLQPPRPL